MTTQAAGWLRSLLRIRDDFGGAATARKRDLIAHLEGASLAAPSLLRFHDTLCFLRAYPDDRALLSQVVRVLRGFSGRSDLRRHAVALRDSGIAGTSIHFRFYEATCRWLAERFPKRVRVDWDEMTDKSTDLLHHVLPLLTLYAETLALDEQERDAREWVEALKASHETDGAFLVRRMHALDAGPFVGEVLYNELDLPFVLEPAPKGPSRTLAHQPVRRVHFQRRALEPHRPDLNEASREQPLSVRSVSGKEAERLIDLAREAMVVRSRDLLAFMHADPRDVRMVEFTDGLAFAVIGVEPERRLLLESMYAGLTLQNGVPIGYVLASALFNSSAIAYNVFDTWRGGESARIYGRALAMVRTLLGADAFSVDPYQLGHDNDEGLASGAWWFYYKLGFRPHDPGVRRVLRRERQRMRRNPRHRSSLRTLQELSAQHLFWYGGDERPDAIGRIPLGAIGQGIAAPIARRFGADRERALAVCSDEVQTLLGLSSLRGFSRGERLAWERWSPVVMALRGVARWSPAERRALVDVIRAKGGRRESEFVRRFDAHPRLRAAVLALATAV